MDKPDIIQLMTSKMAYLTERQRVLSENVANADTPDFKAKDLAPFSFKDTLSQVMVAPRVTNAKHLTTGPATPDGIVIKKVKSGETLPSGNNVVLEEQMVQVSNTAVDYQMITSLYKKWHNLFRAALGRAAG